MTTFLVILLTAIPAMWAITMILLSKLQETRTRDKAALIVMQIICENTSILANGMPTEHIVQTSYHIADAMIKHRNNGN